VRRPPKTPGFFAVDLDGTLVESRQPVHPEVIAAVKRVMAAGIAVTIVTGRMVVGAKPFADLLGLDGEIICYQGAVIADARTGRFEREVALPNALALRAYAVAKAHDFHIQFYRDDRFYVEENNAYAQLYARTSGSEPIVVPSLPEAFEGRDSTKVNIVTDPARTPGALALFTDALGSDAYVTRSNPEFVEILNARVDKGAALRLVAGRLGVAMENVIAIGDSYNDLPLLRAAGFSVAMGSAPDELKALADAVVGDVEHDGVAEAIERFVLPPYDGGAAGVA
jgi:Cof subfamily protein (haloacid dehalogenase superfamily)